MVAGAATAGQRFAGRRKALTVRQIADRRLTAAGRAAVQADQIAVVWASWRATGRDHDRLVIGGRLQIVIVGQLLVGGGRRAAAVVVVVHGGGQVAGRVSRVRVAQTVRVGRAAEQVARGRTVVAVRRMTGRRAAAVHGRTDRTAALHDRRSLQVAYRSRTAVRVRIAKRNKRTVRSAGSQMIEMMMIAVTAQAAQTVQARVQLSETGQIRTVVGAQRMHRVATVGRKSSFAVVLKCLRKWIVADFQVGDLCGEGEGRG